MTKNLYEYRSYKRYLYDTITEKPSNGRGERSKIAKILNCHLAYVSQVLNGPAQLSLEQADALNEYLGHSPSEADFFLLLVQVERAGTESLKKRFLKRVEQIVSERELLKNRLKDQKELSKDIQPEYYSYWYYTAIHFLIACPEFQTKEALCEKLSLPMPIVTQVLEFLLSALQLENASPSILRSQGQQGTSLLFRFGRR